MELKIVSRKYRRTFNFFMSENGSYVYLEKDGELKQITHTGGSTVTATPETFETVCRKWYRDFYKNVMSHYSTESLIPGLD